MSQPTIARPSESTAFGPSRFIELLAGLNPGRARTLRTRRVIAFAAATFVLGATACTTPSTHSSPAQPVGLMGIDWVLNDASLTTLVHSVAPGIHIDLRFDADQATGSAGCNSYGAGFQAIGGSISFGPVRSTQKACADQVMAAEAAYLRALEGSTTYKATASTLQLSGGAADLSFT